MIEKLTESEKIYNELREREKRWRHSRAIKYVLQTVRYLMGYLIDYPIHVIPDFTKNPITVIIKIYTGIDDLQVDAMPPLLFDRLKKMEEELTRIAHRIAYSEVPESKGQNRTDQS
jgi:hypothetical protein